MASHDHSTAPGQSGQPPVGEHPPNPEALRAAVTITDVAVTSHRKVAVGLSAGISANTEPEPPAYEPPAYIKVVPTAMTPCPMCRAMNPHSHPRPKYLTTLTEQLTSTP